MNNLYLQSLTGISTYQQSSYFNSNLHNLSSSSKSPSISSSSTSSNTTSPNTNLKLVVSNSTNSTANSMANEAQLKRDKEAILKYDISCTFPLI